MSAIPPAMTDNERGHRAQRLLARFGIERPQAADRAGGGIVSTGPVAGSSQYLPTRPHHTLITKGPQSEVEHLDVVLGADHANEARAGQRCGLDVLREDQLLAILLLVLFAIVAAVPV